MKSWNGHDDARIAPQRAPSGARFLTAAFVALVLVAGLDTIFPSFQHRYIPNVGNKPRVGISHGSKSFEWSQIEAQEYLEFHECFDGFECAKLSLPLDYFNGTFPDATVSVAIAKLPAKVSINDPRYGGPILLNPGGPGGPGAQFALSTAKSLQWVVDADSKPTSAEDDSRFFDIIGFDPRGIGETTPAATCISDAAAAWSWRLRESEEGILGSSDAALGRLWSMTHALGSSCRLAMDEEDGPDVKQYMTTAFVARDMLEIVERHAEYNVHKVARETHNNGKRSGPHTNSHPKYTPGEAKLQYWGFSYGTFLGSTFASMFPDRVGRAVLDGVVNEWDYVHSLGNGSLVDSEKAMESFYSYCLLSGSTVCPLALENTTTTAEIKERVERIINSLYHNPFILASADGPEVFTYSDLKSTIFSSIYQPHITFEILGQLLAQLEAGHGDLIDYLSKPFRLDHTLSCDVNGNVNPSISYTNDVPTFAILCADGIDQQNLSPNEFVEYWHLLQTISYPAGDLWAMLKMKCAAWKITASYKFDGEYGGNTSYPILFVSNTADPVTPLRSGRIMQSKFPNSRLLVNDQAGHCSFSATNLCAYERIKAYFQTGALPAKDTLCVPPLSTFSLNSTDPASPFYDPTLGTSTQIFADSKAHTEQQNMHDAANKLRRVMAESDIFGFSSLIGNKRAVKLQQLAASRHHN
ncbi:TAP-like protein-domain-containing protein [Boeremia exigua]|uniref:TAP-like protein-domain-containing protein n=1 Tax=Boeremia exigua TaxID=749465 RepID=UPI001E8EC2E0|nr:TAP-like protein-domain-containing protein [Boeremia exigua]KAH6638378.1 TAP-like protein-domain-containing protein [Boeremia exigua]